MWSRLRKYTGSAQVQIGLPFFFFFWNETLRFVSLFGNTTQVWALPAQGSLGAQIKSAGCVGGGWGAGRASRVSSCELSFSCSRGEWPLCLSASSLHGSLEGGSQLPGNVASPAGQVVSGLCAGGRGGGGWGRWGWAEQTQPPATCWPLHSDLRCLEMHLGLSSSLASTFPTSIANG